MKHPTLSDRDLKVVRYVKQNPKCTTSAIAAALGMDARSVYRSVGKLQRSWLVFAKEDHKGVTRLTYIDHDEV